MTFPDKLGRSVVKEKVQLVVGAAVLSVLSFSGSAMMVLSYKDGANSANGIRATQIAPLRKPNPDDYAIIFVNHDRMLMRYDGYIYYLRAGDVLPNGSKIVGVDPEPSEQLTSSNHPGV